MQFKIKSKELKMEKLICSIISIILLFTFIITSYAQVIYYVVSGNSMHPTFKDGDIVKVEKQEEYNDGDIVVADVGGKKVIKRINGDMLEGDNKKSTARYRLFSADILGKAEYNTDKLTDEEKAEFEKVFASGVEMISAGEFHTVALKSDGTVYGWGNNGEGELGDGTTINRKTPVKVLGVEGNGNLTGICQISAGKYHTVALKNDGTVYGWGNNGDGELGDGTIIERYTPVQVLGVGGVEYLTGVSQISAGGYHTVALKSDGTVYSWGSNANGQLGDNTIIQRDTPVQVLGVGGSEYLTGIRQVSAAGGGYTVAVKNDGTVYAWGFNGYGQLGNNTTDESHTPIQTLGVGGSGSLTGISQVSVGRYHTLALKSDGTVYGWGNNGDGELGDNTIIDKITPIQVYDVGGSGYLNGISQVSAGKYHSVALKGDGTAYGWGNNGDGEVGDNTIIERHLPVQILDVEGSGNLTGVSQIVAGSYHTVALKSDGTVYAWGFNAYGQLGDDTIIQKNVPVQVQGGMTGNTYLNISSAIAYDERKWFKYYLGLDSNAIIKVMLVATKIGNGVKQGAFTRDEILDAATNKFKSGSIYYIDREGKIQLYN
ncbi:MAG TPA: hypothetical protein DEP72_06585 [Clostridiales bacterium]|nr:MAG: hypothetical protein A2Y18_08590 [Clostridiales bacterium GWD2_32_19]HCC07805.1 hypothetical protein [Clostridiales bacterium]